VISEVVLQTNVTQVADSINAVWILVASFLVFIMQPGFALLEAGQVRAKNVANVAMKNMMDWSLGVLTYFVLGLGIAGLVGAITSPGAVSVGAAFSYVNDPGAWIQWLFGAVFAMTAATIVSGAVAERIRFGAFVAYAVVVTSIIYPVAQGLAWQGLLSAQGYLGQLLGTGYIDFAGGTVVHMVGGLAGLTAAAYIGPRIGRFDDEGNSQPLPGHSVFLALLGTLVLAFGWYGFNLGTQTTVLTQGGAFMGEALGRVALATTLAMGAGAVASALVTTAIRGTPDPLFTANGLLGGLVAITSGAGFVTWWGAIAIGAVGGGIVQPTFNWVLDSLTVDDVCGVFAVHGAAGGVGAILVPVFTVGSGGAWSVMGVNQFLMQVAGVTILGTWTVLATIAVLGVISLGMDIRVSEDDERDGLDASEHNISAYPEFNVQRASRSDTEDDEPSDDGGHSGREPAAPTAEADSTTMWRGEEIGGDSGPAGVARETLVTALSQPAFVIDDGGTVTHANDDAERLFEPIADGGVATEQSLDHLPGLDEETRAKLRQVVQSGDPLIEHRTRLERNGDSREITLSATPIQGGESGALIVLRDVTDAETERRRDRALIQYRDDVLSTFRARLERLANGDLNVESGVPTPETTDFETVTSAHEEAKALDGALSTIVGNVHGIVEKLPDQSAQLARRSESLNELSNEVRSITDETDDLTSEIADEIKQLAEEASDAAEIVENQTAAIEEISASTTEISQQAGEAASLTEDAVTEVQDAVTQIREATTVSKAVSDDIQTLDDRMETVEEIVTIINDIADQTNILALNASIEAARAGQKGEGFAVVADEVKTLAEETQDQADDIADIIGELKGDTTSAVESIQTANEQVTTSANALTSVVEILETTRERVEETNQGIEEISNAADRQADDASSVSHTIEDVSALATEINDHIERISTNVDEQTEAVGTVADTADDLEALAAEMDENVDAFSTKARREIGASD